MVFCVLGTLHLPLEMEKRGRSQIWVKAKNQSKSVTVFTGGFSLLSGVLSKSEGRDRDYQFGIHLYGRQYAEIMQQQCQIHTQMRTPYANCLSVCSQLLCHCDETDNINNIREKITLSRLSGSSVHCVRKDMSKKSSFHSGGQKAERMGRCS